MRKRVLEDKNKFKPRYYTGDRVVKGSHVARYDCHTKYHVEKKLFDSKSTGSATESSITSVLTDE
jgi:hypothetical protein